MQFSKQDLEMYGLTDECFPYVRENKPLTRGQKKAFIAMATYHPIGMTEEEIAEFMILYKMEDMTDIELDIWMKSLFKNIEDLKIVRLN